MGKLVVQAPDMTMKQRCVYHDDDKYMRIYKYVYCSWYSAVSTYALTKHPRSFWKAETNGLQD